MERAPGNNKTRLRSRRSLRLRLHRRNAPPEQTPHGEDDDDDDGTDSDTASSLGDREYDYGPIAHLPEEGISKNIKNQN